MSGLRQEKCGAPRHGPAIPCAVYRERAGAAKIFSSGHPSNTPRTANQTQKTAFDARKDAKSAPPTTPQLREDFDRDILEMHFAPRVVPL